MAPVSLCGIGFDAHSSFLRGAAQGPGAIRAALASPASNAWTETGVDLRAPGVLADLGDLDLSGENDPFGAIEATAGTLFDRGGLPLFLGGDHAITWPLVRAAARAHPGLALLHLDAHPDCYNDYEGDPFSHACPMARIMEEGLAARLVQVGVRTINGEQHAQMERFGIEAVEMRYFGCMKPLHFQGPVYVSLDLDALDPAFAPGVSHPEPGGMTTRQVMEVLHGLRGRIVGADVVELNPSRDPQGLTAMVAAKLVKELAGLMVLGAEE